MSLASDYRALKALAIKKQSEIETTKRQLVSNQDKLQAVQKLLDEAKDSQTRQLEAIQVLKQIIDKMSQDHINRIRKLVTYALKTIFFDKDYAFEIEVDDARNTKNAYFYLLERVVVDGKEKIIKSDFDDGIGQGVRTIVGFTLQVFYIGYFQQSPVMFLDEAFTYVSDQYIPYLMEFLNQLSEKKDFIFVLVSHDPRIIPYANRVYSVKNGTVTLERNDAAAKGLKTKNVQDGDSEAGKLNESGYGGDSNSETEKPDKSSDS